MKNLIALFTLATFLFLTSCAKEEIIQLEATPEIVTESQAKKSMAATTVGAFEAKGSTSLIPVTTDSYSIVGNELIVEFSSSHDFSTFIEQPTQQLDFVDSAGNISKLTFQINSHTGGNGYLDVAFAIGGNNLSGLGMEVGQGIIVEEVILD